MIELSQEFGFDAAHYLGNGAAENRRLHGHSFYAEVTLRSEQIRPPGFCATSAKWTRRSKPSRDVWTTGC